MGDSASDWPQLSFPEEEATVLERHYRAANVILEYGSGGSTVLASRMPGKLVFSVESDRRWALDLQCRIDMAALPSPAILYPVNIGLTAEWGRPVNENGWRCYHRYPTAVWAEPWFRHPDLILIDGRLRPACFVAACLRIKRPVTLLFDDYRDRKSYHVVEELVKPKRLVGRMAEFRLEPANWPIWVHDLLLELCTKMTYSNEKSDYSRVQSNVLTRRRLVLKAREESRRDAVSPDRRGTDH